MNELDSHETDPPPKRAAGLRCPTLKPQKAGPNEQMKPRSFLILLLGLLWAHKALATWCLPSSSVVLTGYEGTIKEGDGIPGSIDPLGPKNCYWSIQPDPPIDPATQTIRLEFSYMGLGYEQAEVAITDLPSGIRYDFAGPDPGQPGMTPVPAPVESLGLGFELDLWTPTGLSSGFILKWKVVPRVPREPQCDPMASPVLYDRSGAVSDGWGNYYTDWGCTWALNPFVSSDGIAPPAASPDESITVHLDHIDISTGWAILHVADGTHDVYWSGHTPSCAIFQANPGQPVTVEFFTNHWFTYTGFELSYTTEPAPAVCPAADFVAASFSQAEVDGDRLVVTTTGYALSEYRIAQGPPTTQTNPACVLPAVRHVADPAGAPCATELSACVLLSTLASCPDVSTEMVAADTLRWRVPLHVLSTVQTGVDPYGEPVFGTRWQSMDLLIDQTVSVEASATVHAMHLVNFTGFEKGDSYFDQTADEYVLHFSIWTNQPYLQDLATGPWLEELTAPVDPALITFARNPAADQNCDDGGGPADPTRFCERAYVMTIHGQPNTCLLEGLYTIGIHVVCREGEHCPSGTEGDYFAQVVIVPGSCEATLIEVLVTGELWVEMDGGTALAWGRRGTVMGQLHADTTLAASRLHELYMCLLPLAPGTTACSENPYVLLVVDDALTPLAVSLHGEYTHSTMLYNTTFDLDLMAFHYTLGVDPNPNLITELQFDAVFDSFVPGHVDPPPGANRNANGNGPAMHTTRTTTTSRQTVRPAGRGQTPTLTSTKAATKGTTANPKSAQQQQQQNQNQKQQRGFAGVGHRSERLIQFLNRMRQTQQQTHQGPILMSGQRPQKATTNTKQQQQQKGQRITAKTPGQQKQNGKPAQTWQKPTLVVPPRTQQQQQRQQWNGQRHTQKMMWISPRRTINRPYRTANGDGEDQGPLVPSANTQLHAKLAIQGATTPVTPEPTPGTPTGTTFNWGTVALVAGTVGGTLLVVGCVVAALVAVRSWRQRVHQREAAAPATEAEECRPSQAANPRVEVLKAVVGTSSAVSPALSHPAQRHTPAPTL
ncbi:hypothetical protein PAPYR_7795 [Paratrimastix pyriformis]|uniref:CUB domain-containing protein n=1 Tax=Paratrimastix pyriformis TaxID=342808 RepID=A0ABQ8UC56_9EUKA|nr:hypothetical protein PAPYR_7795 [Paratrimastix pyriformis]